MSQQGHLNILFSTHYPPSIAISNGNISINQRLSDYSLMINSQNVCIPAHLFNIHEILSLNIPLRKLKWKRTVVSLIKMSQNNNLCAFERRMQTNAQDAGSLPKCQGQAEEDKVVHERLPISVFLHKEDYAFV